MLLPILLLPFLPLTLAAKPPYFFLVGDSTTAKKGGWGDAFLSNLIAPATGENRAQSGASTDSWKAAKRWEKLFAGLNATRDAYEPVVTIQFGHNDQKGLTLEQFGVNLEEYAVEISKAGGTPIFITPLTRRGFENGEVVQNLREWCDKMVETAEAVGVKWLDLNLKSTDYVNAIGEANADFYNYELGDKTHLNDAGKIVFGRMVIDLLLPARPDLAEYFETNPALSEKLANNEFATGEEGSE